MSDEEEGLPLAEALRVYGDPELWAAYEGARARLRSIPPRPSWLHDSRWAREQWTERSEETGRAARDAVDQAWKVLYTDFIRRLQGGDLEATGMKVPLDEDSQPIVIARHLWSVLTPNFTRSSAKGHGIEFVDVHVHRVPLDTLSVRYSADPIEQDGDELGEAMAREAADPPAPGADTERRGRGQPNLKKYIEAELERRAAEGQLCALQAEEFRSLEAWAREEQKEGRLPEHRIPKARSIEKGLAKRYQELKAKKSMR